MRPGLPRTALGCAAALLVAVASPASAETRRPPAPVLIAAAKATPLAKFQVKDEIRDFTLEAWLKDRVGRKGRIAWRSTSCHAKAGDRDIVNSPICVEATIRYANGIAIVVGVGFDANSPPKAPVADAMWGEIAVRGRGCEFLRHPDHIDAALTSVDEMIRTGRCS